MRTDRFYHSLTFSASRSLTVGNGVLVDILCLQAARSSTGARYSRAADQGLGKITRKIRISDPPSHRHVSWPSTYDAAAAFRTITCTYPGAARVSRGCDRDRGSATLRMRGQDECVRVCARARVELRLLHWSTLIETHRDTEGEDDDSAQCFCCKMINASTAI